MKLSKRIRNLFIGKSIPFQYFSQDGQDKYLDENIFKGQKKGIFIEIGAHDGVTFSNTYFFEKFRNWKGICIEPNPDVFKKLKKNRKSKNVNACISNADGIVNYVKVTGYSEMLSGIREHYDEKHWHRLERELKEYGGSKEIIKVEGYKLDTILNSLGYLNKTIDFCSIDVEGAELEILKNIDFGVIHIKVLSVENAFNTNEALEFLKTKGYVRNNQLGADDIFIKKINNYDDI